MNHFNYSYYEEFILIMNAPCYLVKNSALDRYSKYAMDLHISRLHLIRGRKNQHMYSTPSPSSKAARTFDDRIINLGKKVEIDKGNQALYQKLSHISNQNSSLPIKVHKQSRSAFKSSYQIFREHQERKIAAENVQIVKKLTEAKPAVQKKTLDEEYAEFKKRKRRLLKLSKIEDMNESMNNKAVSPFKNQKS